MSKRVQLVLNKDVAKLGKVGDLVEVAPGYARNYLLPQGIAYNTTPGILRQVERRKEAERQRQLELKQQAENRRKAIETGINFIISKQVGEGESIFGTVTTQEVAELLFNTTGQEIDRRVIHLPEIRKTGSYKAEIKLHAEVTAEIEIKVVSL